MNGQNGAIGPAPGPALASCDAGPSCAPDAFWQVVATAEAWNCRCHGQCSALQAADCLYRTAIAVLSGPVAPPAATDLLRPLSLLVSRQKTREGQAECARFAAALADHNQGAVVDSCHRLIEQERGRSKAWATSVGAG